MIRNERMHVYIHNSVFFRICDPILFTSSFLTLKMVVRDQVAHKAPPITCAQLVMGVVTKYLEDR